MRTPHRLKIAIPTHRGTSVRRNFIRSIATQFLSMFALLVLTIAPPAIAQLETLAPETARAEVGATQGVVLVDLFADW
jgi:hypothetical protein